MAGLLEVDYGVGVVGAELEVGLLEGGFGGGVGVEDVLGGEGGEFGEIGAQIDGVRVEFFALGDGVEDAEVGRGVGAAASDPLPTGAVVGKVGVEEGVPKPAFAVVPVQAQVFHQEGADDHAHAVVHVAGLPEFSHASVD